MAKCTNVTERLVDKRCAILDMEFIAASSNHRCIRKLYILAENGFTDMEMEFYPCKRYNELEPKYKRSYQFCRRNIHNLSYNPWKFSPPCLQAQQMLNKFVVHNGITMVLFKGGIVERDMCRELGIESMNIELLGEVVKTCSHDPREEVNFYYDQLINFELLKKKI